MVSKPLPRFAHSAVLSESHQMWVFGGDGDTSPLTSNRKETNIRVRKAKGNEGESDTTGIQFRVPGKT